MSNAPPQHLAAWCCWASTIRTTSLSHQECLAQTRRSTTVAALRPPRTVHNRPMMALFSSLLDGMEWLP